MELRLSGRVVDLDRGEVHAGASRLRLTTREVELLSYLADRVGEPVSRDELHTEVWGMASTVHSRAVDFTLHRLRGKLEPDPAEPRHLLKVHGVGYKLLVDPHAEGTYPRATVLAGHVDRAGLRWRQDADATDRAVLALRECVSEVARALGGTVSSTYPPLVAFPRADDALAAARRLVGSDPPLTVALATGGVSWWLDAGRVEVQGWTAERAGLLARSWQPGHVVLDAETARALGDADLRDLGLQVPSELPERLRIFEAPMPSASRVEPVSRTTNLWRFADRLVGRTAELQQVDELVRCHGVVALWGPAGVGKTRLAREVGLRWLDGSGEAWFCDLRPAASADEVLVAIAEATGLPADRHRGGRALRSRGTVLLLLDNAEHLVAEVVDLAVAWAAEAPDARLLITTRARPEVDVVVPLGPLGAADGAALLVERAQRLRPGFGRDEPEAVAALVARLGGVPLALELAAAGAGTRTAAQLLASLGEGGDPGMEAALAWSWAQLEPVPRRVLVALSVFPSGFSLEDAEAVAGVADALDHVATLQAWSLVVEGVDAEGPRLALYDAVRRFAGARDEAELRAAAARHTALVLTRAEAALAQLHGLGEAAAVRTLRRDLPDLLAVVERARNHGDEPTRGRGVAALAALLGRTGPRSLLKDLAEPMVPGAEAHEPAVAMALLRTAWSLWHQDGRKEAAAEALERCIAVAGRCGDEVQELLAAGRLATLREPVDERESRMAEVADRLEALGAPGFAGIVAIEVAHGFVVGGQLEHARAWYTRGLGLQRRAGDRRGEGVMLINLGNLLRYVGDWEEAAAHAHAAVRLLEETGDERNAAMALGLLGSCLAGAGSPGEGVTVLERALVAMRRAGAETEELGVLNNLAEALLLTGDVAGTRQRATEGLELARSVGAGWWADANLPLLAAARWVEGDRDGAIDELERLVPRLERHGSAWSWKTTLAAWMAVAGRRDDALGLLDALPEVPEADDTGESVGAVRAFVGAGDDGPIRAGTSWMLRRLAALLPAQGR